MGHDGLAGVPEPDRLAAEVGLEPDEEDGGDGRPQDRPLAAVVEDREDRHPEDQEADQRRDGAVDPLDPDLEPGIEPGQELALEAAGPVRAREAGIGGANGHADHDEHERGDDGRGGKPLEAGQGSSGVSARGF